MNHVVLPLDPDHQVAVASLSQRLAGVAGVPAPAGVRAHITVVAYEDIDREVVLSALAPVVEAVVPFIVHAHGYGLFTGPDPSDLGLHVPVIRTRALDLLHELVVRALRGAGADVARWSEAERWSPHVTLLAHDLSPSGLAAAVGWLAGHRHPSWQIPLDRLEVTGGWPDRAEGGDQLPFATGP